MNVPPRTVGLALAVCLAVSAASGRAHANIVFFTSESAFDAAAGSLLTQTFASAHVSTLSVIANPLNSASNNSVFAAGSILPDLTITSSVSHSGQDLAVVAANIFGNPNKAVYNNFGGDSLYLSFATPVFVVAVDLLNPNGTRVGVTVDGPGLSPIGTDTATANSAGPPTFLGAIAMNGDSIGRIEFLGAATSGVGTQDFAGVSRVLFSAPLVSVPEPSVLVLGSILTVGFVSRRAIRGLRRAS